MLRSRGICFLFLLVGLPPALAQIAQPEIIIDGLPDELRRNVELLLGIEQHKADADLTEQRLRALHEKAPQEIRRALEPFGYYRAYIRGALTRTPGGWVARYRVEPGPVLHVDHVDLRIDGAGANDPEFDKLAQTLPLRDGDVLRHARYEDAKRALLALAAERGYLDAQLERSELRVDRMRYTATAVLHLNTGARYRFGTVRFQQEFFDPEFLADFVGFRRGDPYSNRALAELQTALSNTDYFKQVDVSPRRDLAHDQEIPVDVALVLRAPNKYTAGLGYGTDTGARGKLGWERRLINASGHRFAAELDLSQVERAAHARYLIPILDPRTDHFALSATSGNDRTVTRTSDTSILGAAINQTWGNWLSSLALYYHHERFITGSDSGTADLLIPTTSWTYVRADNRMYPRHGGRVQLDLRGANESVASNLSFWQIRLDGKYIFPLGANGRVSMRAEAGEIVTARFNALPASLRFYTGGTNTVRGYTYQSLGGTDSNGRVIGGRYLLLGSVEYEQRVWKSLGAAIFYDQGNAYNDRSDPLKEGAGIGLRWHLPLGVVQLDAAQALSRDDRPWRVHFGIGAEL